MKKQFHELRVSTFVHATESEDKVEEAVMNLCCGMEFPVREKKELEGVSGNRIISLLFITTRQRQILELLQNWKRKDFWSIAMEQVEDRLDEGNHFHMRVDKQSALEGDIGLWKEGESIKVVLKVATFPSSRERSIEILNSLS